MARKVELALLVLDVAPTMTPHLPLLRRAVHTLLHSKLVDKRSHQVSIVLSGTAASNNNLAENFGDNQYSNISIVENLDRPSLDTARRVDAALAAAAAPGSAAPRGADWLNALIVGWDGLWTALYEDSTLMKAHIRLILVSDFASPSVGDPTSELVSLLAHEFASVDAVLEVINVDLPLPDPLLDANKAANLALLRALCEQVRHRERSVTVAGELAGVFRAVEPPVTSPIIATMHLELGNTLKIPVKLTYKVKQAKQPPLGSLSPLERPVNDGGPAPGTVGVSRATDWYRPSDTAQAHPVSPRERVHGYRYGKESVPFGDEEDTAVDVVTQRDLRILGFLPQSNVPREHYMGEVVAALANPDSPAAVAALATLVRAMARREDAAIVRLVRQAKAKVEVCVALPVPATGDATDHLLIIPLPFWEDVRPMTFPSLTGEGMVPSAEQRQAVSALVDAMTLDDDDLLPQRTAAPSLHRFSTFFMEKALEGGSTSAAGGGGGGALPNSLAFENDTLLQRVVRGASDKPGVAAAAARLAEVFPTGHAARQQRAAVHRLRPGHGEEDLAKMVEQGNMAEATAAARREIVRLVEQSVGGTGHAEAVRLLCMLRDACTSRRHGSAFNQVLFHLESNVAANMTRRRFWKRVVVDAGLAPVSAEEVAAEATGGEVGFGGHLMAADKVEEWKEKQLAMFVDNGSNGDAAAGAGAGAGVPMGTATQG